MAVTLSTTYQEILSVTASYGSYAITEKLWAKYISQSVENNQSIIQLKWTYVKTGGTGVWDSDNSVHKVTYVSNGSTTADWSVTFNIPTGNPIDHESGQITITHDSDGTYSKNWDWSISSMYDDRAHSGTITGVTLPSIARDPLINLKVSGAWKKGKPYIKVNGAWKKASKVYVKINGAWKECSEKG